MRMPRLLTSVSLNCSPIGPFITLSRCAASRQMYGASTIEIDGTHAPKLAAPSVTICCTPFAVASIVSRELPSCPFGKAWMLIRPCDLSFTFAAIFSIIWTDGCVAGTTSLQRIVTCCAIAAVAAIHALAITTPLIRSIASPPVVRFWSSHLIVRRKARRTRPAYPPLALQPMRMIGQREPSPLDPFTTCKREHFEQLAHLGRGGEHLHSRCFAQVGEGFRRRDLAQPIENAAGQEKRRLRREACDRKTRAFSRFGNRGEIDVRREIRQTGPQKRIAVRAMPIVAHQRAFVSLGMVILAPRKAIIDDQQGSGREPSSEMLDQRLRRRIDLAPVIALRRKACCSDRLQSIIAQWPFRPRESIAIERHAPLQPHAATTRDHMRRYRVQHFVQQDHPVDPRRQLRCPFDPRQFRGRGPLDRRALPLAQILAHLNDAITHGRRTGGGEG